MKTVCERNKCAGCMACIDVCPKDAVNIQDSLSAYNAVIDEEKCINCNACHKVCQRNHFAQLIEPQLWYQGWANDPEIRKKGSSGGVASELAKTFLDEGGVVCSCVFSKGEFVFEFAETKKELHKFAGSKYVKSNPIGIYKDIRKKLSEEKKVLFIGLPCQVSAVKRFIPDKLQNNLYTIDLICHGTPSPKILEKFLEQYKCKLSEMKDVQFRKKAKFQVLEGEQGVVEKGVCDRYLISFLNSLNYTDNCYECQYARFERVSDITLGDSWGSELSEEEQKQGVSLILVQTDQGSDLLKRADLHLVDVDLEKAIENNHQLKEPSKKTGKRTKFFDGIKKGKSYNGLVYNAFPKKCLRQDIKKMLIKLRLYEAK
ncbi:MAG: Coenzyme F420 hydrogenase/dehydrogenase, beta subunit C-terminal domain [Lachnospiraceae bacterium]|nr:Coenzyme F420 hydrogenase/dehydrogenase, beta subunit C-terminal domain [Lachnospiraceae bacterium]